MESSILPLCARMADGDNLALVRKKVAVYGYADFVSPRWCAAPASSLSALAQCLCQIVHAGVDGAELRRVRFRHVDSELLVQSD